MFKKIVFFCNLLFISNFGLSQTVGSGADHLDLLWPTNASYELTSSFAEYRATHFHYGIDIKTWNKIGYDVYASEGGYISRIRVSPVGYGKAIYITHPGGYQTVYAHLDKFHGQIQEFIINKHYSLKRNELDLYLNPKDLPIKRGDKIAYTGETGVGTPHLHWEVRDPQGNQLNPLLVMKKQPTKDATKPRLTAIAFKPLTLSSFVNETNRTIIYKNFDSSTSGYSLGETPVLSGTVGVAVDGYDVSDGGFNKFGFHRLTLEINGDLFFDITYDQFPINKSRYILVDRDYELFTMGKGRFTKLYQDEIKELPKYKFKNDTNGKLEHLTSGRYQGKITAEDVSGNKQSLYFQFIYEAKETANPLLFSTIQLPPNRKMLSIGMPDGENKSTEFSPINIPSFEPFYYYKGGLGLSDTMSFSTDLSIRGNELTYQISAKDIDTYSFRVSVKNGSSILTPTTFYSDEESISFLYKVDSTLVSAGFFTCIANDEGVVKMDQFPFSYAHPHREIFIRRSNGLTLKSREESLFKADWISLSDNGKSISEKDFTFSIGPRRIPLLRSLIVTIPLPENSPKTLALYRIKDKDKPAFESHSIENGILTAYISTMGTFQLINDKVAPTLNLHSPKNRIISPKTQRLIFSVTDDLSGIQSSSIQVLLNGQWNYAEYDPEEHRIYIPLDKTNGKETITVDISITDQVKNKVSKKINFTVQK